MTSRSERPETSTTEAVPPDKPDSGRLADSLVTLVRNGDYGSLAQLRRANVQTNAHIKAGWHGYEHREVFERVAFLFAIYHQGSSTPSYGDGSFGEAVRRISHGDERDPKHAGAERLFDRIVASRRIPWRHLRHAVARLRSCEEAPPSWELLANDLMKWHDRKARIAYHWSVDFHTPRSRPRGTTSTQPKRKDMTT